MAGSQMNNLAIHQNNRRLQRKDNADDRPNIDAASPSPSIHPFPKIEQKLMSRSSTEAPQIVRNLHESTPISKSSGIHRRNSVTPMVACPSDDGNRRFTHHTASSTNRLAAANDRFAHQNHRAQDCARLLQTARSLRPASASKDRRASADHTLIGNHGSVMQHTSSSIKESHRLPLHQKAVIAKADSVPIPHQVEEKLASRKLTRTSTQRREIPVTEKNPKGRIETNKDLIASRKRQNELCKDCKASIMESVCFISNEGRITAALMHPLHYCKKPGCAANRNHHPSASTSSKRAPVSKRQAPLAAQARHSKSNLHNLAELGDRSSASASMSSFHGADYDNKKQGLIQIKEGSMAARSLDGDVESLLTDMDSLNLVSDSSPCRGEDVLDGLLHRENLQCSFLRQNGGSDQQIDKENNSTPTGSYISSDIIHDHDGDDGDHEMGSAFEGSTPAKTCISSDINIHDHDGDNGNREMGSAVEQDVIDDFKSFCYHGDNEYSCSEDGTDATTTPTSLVKGAFDNLSNLDIEEHPDSKTSPSKKSSVARLRRRYLEALREQEAEKVRLRKQEIMARKQAGDWMLDCHMEELLHRLAPNGEARVKVLVEAFETVIHHSDSEGSQTHHQEHNQMHDVEQEEENILHLDTSFSN